MSIQHVSLRQLRVFEAAATNRSFSKAAEALHLTQPGVSMHIKELETNAGLPLFERIGRKLYVTEAGQELLARAREILRALNLFDGIFAVLVDRDAELTRAALAWAEAEGRIGEATPELVAKMGLDDADVEALVAERTAAKKSRNFARADAIRNELLAKGIVLEDSKDGVRWKRK